jgi:hypothetical protein
VALDAVEVLGHLGHGLAQALRVLLGHHDREPELARALDEHAGVVDDRVELAHRRAERLLHVDHDERRAIPLEHAAHVRVTSAKLPASRSDCDGWPPAAETAL